MREKWGVTADGYGVSIWDSGNRQRLHNIVNVLNATELYTLLW